MIACIRLPYFAAQVAQTAQPALRDRPFALVDRAAPERLVGISAGAAEWGVHSGMRAAEAQGWCPALTLVPASPLLQLRAQDALGDLLAALTPKVAFENTVRRYKGRGRRPRQLTMPQLSDDALVVYIDPGRMTAAQGAALGEQIRGQLKEVLGLHSVVGLAATRFTAHVAALHGPAVRVVRRRESAAFLAPFPVDVLPADAETLRQLHLLGLATLGSLAALPAGAVEARFGSHGRFLHRLASGEDPTPVREYKARITAQARTLLDTAITQRPQLERAVLPLAERAAHDLAAQRVVTRDITLRLGLDDRTHLEQTLVPRQPLTAGRVGAAARELLTGLTPHAGVRAITVVLTGIEPPMARQLSLFERDPVAVEHLHKVLHHLAPRYGPHTFVRAVVVDAEARHPAQRVRWETVA